MGALKSGGERGLGFLPWERLPAYILGPLFGAFSIWLLIADDERPIGRLILEIGCLVFAVWIVWARYKTGAEPLWAEEQRRAARRRKEMRE